MGHTGSSTNTARGRNGRTKLFPLAVVKQTPQHKNMTKFAQHR